MAQEQLEETTNVALNAISRVAPIPDLPDRKIFCIMEKKGVKIMTTKERKRQTPQCYDDAFKAGAVRMVAVSNLPILLNSTLLSTSGPGLNASFVEFFPFLLPSTTLCLMLFNFFDYTPAPPPG